jgi:hypothetical protein
VFIGVNRAISAPSNNIHTYKIRNMAKVREGFTKKQDIFIHKTVDHISPQGLPVPTVGTSMAVTITHVFLWGSRATNHIENALMGSPCFPVCLVIVVLSRVIKFQK